MPILPLISLFLPNTMVSDERRRRSRRRNRSGISMAELWLIPLMERYYEPNKTAIVALAVVLLPFCIRFLIPSVKITLPLPLPDLWNFMPTWITPPLLFLLLNLVIGTIAVTSTRNPNKKKKKKIDKIKNAASIPWNASGTHEESFFEEDEENTLEQTVSTPLVEPSNPILRRRARHKPPPAEDPNVPRSPSLVEPRPHPSLNFSRVGRNKSESPAFVRVLEVPPTSNLMRSVEGEEKNGTDTNTTEELNAKADDFIQKFKQQLMLQRLQSFRERQGRVRK
ncbi:hypothetical protein KI387_020943 [Taxus chinensis]|uniref:DUF4408 domain-containing protein n=1 Tax=Taxus chinensis TaxID=29808 RepID=A0AA38LBL6_TAXCH|nr:hypothetical protein KI387_020943 [Taxus chinensis]